MPCQDCSYLTRSGVSNEPEHSLCQPWDDNQSCRRSVAKAHDACWQKSFCWKKALTQPERAKSHHTGSAPAYPAAVWWCGAQSLEAELPVSLQDGLRRPQGLFPACQDVVQDAASFGAQGKCGHCSAMAWEPIAAWDLALHLLSEGNQSPSAQDCWGEAGQEMVAFPLLGFLWALLHEPFLQWCSLSATLGSLPSKDP